MDSYSRSVALSPNSYAEARLSHGNLLVQPNRLPEAIVQYEEAVRLDPRAADNHNNLGGVLDESGRLAGGQGRVCGGPPAQARLRRRRAPTWTT